MEDGVEIVTGDFARVVVQLVHHQGDLGNQIAQRKQLLGAGVTLHVDQGIMDGVGTGGDGVMHGGELLVEGGVK